MKKEYVPAEVEVIKLVLGDVITTSGGGIGNPDSDPDDPFSGGYDSDGWT